MKNIYHLTKNQSSFYIYSDVFSKSQLILSDLSINNKVLQLSPHSSSIHCVFFVSSYGYIIQCCTQYYRCTHLLRYVAQQFSRSSVNLRRVSYMQIAPCTMYNSTAGSYKRRKTNADTRKIHTHNVLETLSGWHNGNNM